MKKLLAAAAAMAVALCSFTACEDKNSSSSVIVQESSSVSNPHIIPEFDRAKAEPIIKETLTNYFNDLNNGDIAASLKYQYDDDMIRAAAVMSGLAEDGDTPDDALEKMIEAYKSTYEGHKITLNEIKSIESIPEDGYVLLDEAYGRLTEINKLIDQCGGTLDMQKITEGYQELVDFSKYRREYEEGYDVVASVTVDDETKDQEMLLFRTVGGDWQMDMSVPSYMQKSEQVDMDNLASSTAGAASAALKEMSEKGLDITGRFIISSDGSMDYKIPDTFDTEVFRSVFSGKYTGAAEAKYFIVVDDLYAPYAVYEVSGQKTGIYPFGLIIKNDGSEKLTYEELDPDKTYDIAALFDMSKKIIG